jgi:hypothetical protein
MPPQYRILQELDSNVRRGLNLSIEETNSIIRMLAGGCTVVEVAKAHGWSDRYIKDLRIKYY